jgi:hypothetical protein
MSVEGNVADAVDLLVDELGRDGAEEELQRRYQNNEQQERVKAGLAVLRRDAE